MKMSITRCYEIVNEPGRNRHSIKHERLYFVSYLSRSSSILVYWLESMRICREFLIGVFAPIWNTVRSAEKRPASRLAY